MAEAAAFVAYTHTHAVKAWVSDAGLTLTFSITIPGPRRIYRELRRHAFAALLGLRSAFYPLSSWTAMTVTIAAALYVNKVGLSHGVGPLTTAASLLLILLLIVAATAAVQRCILSLLLRQHSFLFSAAPGRPTLARRVWAGAIKALTQSNAQTNAFQNIIPRQPIPNLKATVSRFLDSAKCVQDVETFTRTLSDADDFLTGVGPRLNLILRARAIFKNHPHTDWWTKFVYLRGRESLMVNSNYYGLACARFKPNVKGPASRAAVIAHSFASFAVRLRARAVEPVQIGGLIPLCMKQYDRAFGTTRIAGREEDELRTSVDSRHIAVSVRGIIYVIDIITNEGVVRGRAELEEDFAAVISAAAAYSPTGRENAIAALTSLPRPRWAQVREESFIEGLNGRSLSAIEGALFFVAFSQDKFGGRDWTGRAKALLTGTSGNGKGTPIAWFDKSISLVFFEDNDFAINAEHSWADAPVVAHLLEDAVLLEGGAPGIDDNGEFAAPANQSIPSAYGGNGEVCELNVGTSIGCATRRSVGSSAPSTWARLAWALPASVENAIDEACQAQVAALSSLDIRVFSTSEDSRVAFGKGFIKTCRVSPDAFVQAALQVAIFRDFKATDGVGRFAATYEAAMTRLFAEGRTETVRPCTLESCAFVMAMEGGADVSPSEKLAALRASAARHVANYQAAMCGEGADRHLFGLAVCARGMGIDSAFLNSAMGTRWVLSTSQQPQNQTGWDASQASWAPRLSPGGGFAPVVEDGYGVSYMLGAESEAFFHVT